MMQWGLLYLLLAATTNPCSSFLTIHCVERKCLHPFSTTTTPCSTASPESSLVPVAGVECRPVVVSALNLTVLEATANAQEILVNAALEDDDVDGGILPSGDPYGMVVWPAAAALGKYLSGRDLSNQHVWEVGSGTGVVSIAAAQQGAKSVYATDYESLTLELLEHAAYKMNSVSPKLLSTGVWDIIRDNDSPLPPADLLVAADVLYEPRTGIALADLVVRALHAGMAVMVADSPGRAGRPAFLERLKLSLIHPGPSFVSIEGSTITDERHELICGEGSSTISDAPKPLPIALLELHSAMLKATGSVEQV